VDGSGHISDGSGHMSELGSSDAAVSFARPLADTVLLVSCRFGLLVLGSPSPPGYPESPGSTGLSVFCGPFSLFVYSVYFVYFGFMGEVYGTPAAVSAPF
jgi:hypothetical protein